MKKLLLFTVLAFAASFAKAQDWIIPVESNIAANEDVKFVVSSIREGSPDQLNDGKDDGNGCSTQRPDFQFIINGQYFTEKNWFIIDLGSSKRFSAVEIKWRDNHADTYQIYTSDLPFEYDNVTTDDNQEVNILKTDLTNLSPIAQGGKNDVTNQDVYFELTSFEPKESRYILIYCQPNEHAKEWGCGILELRIGLIENPDELVALYIPSNKLMVNETAYINISALSKVGELVDNFDNFDSIELTCSDSEAFIIEGNKEIGHFAVLPKKIGLYTLNATGTTNDGLTITGSSNIIVSVNWNDGKTKNIAHEIGITITGRKSTDLTTPDPNPFENAIDNNPETYYEYNGDYAGGDSWLVIDLKNPYSIDQVSVLFDDTYEGIFKISFGGKDAVIPKDDVPWIDNDAYEGWTSSESIKKTPSELNDYFPSNLEDIYYIAFRDISNPGGKPRYAEIYIAGTPKTNISWDNLPADINSHSYPKSNVVAIFSNYYNKTELPDFASGSMTHINTSTPNKVKALAEEDIEEESSAETGNKVLLFEGEKTVNGSVTINVNEDVSNATTFNMDVYCQTTGIISISAVWEYGNIKPDTSKKVYKAEITSNELNRWNVVQFDPKEIGYDTDNVRTIKQLIITSNIPEFAIDNCYFAGSSPLAVETVDAEGNGLVDVYTLTGIRVAKAVNFDEIKASLAKGMYIVGGKKVLVK